MAKQRKTPEELREYNSKWRKNQREDKEVKKHEQKIRQKSSQKNQNEHKKTWNNNNRQKGSPLHQQEAVNRKKRRTEMEHIIAQYERAIREGPTYTCFSCKRIWFPNSVVKYQGKLIEAAVRLKLNCPVNENSFICRTCKTSISKNKIPTLAGPEYELPQIPDEVKLLNCLELQLISERLPFMKILTSLRGYGQKKLHGNIINVPLDIDTTTSVLPRSLETTQVIKLKLKRRQADKSHYLFHNVNVGRVWAALGSLLKRPLYQNITMDTEWLQAALKIQNSIPETEEEDQEEEENVRDDFSLNGAMGDTLMQQNSVTCFAPGQGRKPLSVLVDANAEEKAHPHLFGGEMRKSENPIKNYTNHIRSELMNEDRRFASDQSNLFYKVRVQICKQINNLKTTFCRKKIQNSINAGQATDAEFVKNMVAKDEGYDVLKSIISSPAHWKAEKEKLMAMIRQVGSATWFLTLSPAETDWLELIRILYELKYKSPISDDELSNMSLQEKAALVNGDPIVVAVYLNRRYREIFKVIEKVIFKNGILHRYKRVEYQMRGSSHEHHLLFCNCPFLNLLDPNTFQEVCDYIDEFVTTHLPEDSPAQDLLKFQTHQHTSTCFKTSKDKETGKCRFGIPYPPMKSTTILLPLSQTNCQDYLALRNKLTELRSILNSKTIKRLSIEELLALLGVTYKDYLRVIRVGLKRETVFLRRTFEDRFINAFNETILTLHRANHDLQFVLSTYSCANYLVNYVGKAHKGVSKTLRELYSAIKNEDLDVKERISRIGYAFTNAQEISCHEAVYTTLGIPQSYISTQVVYLSTNPPEERVRMIKPKKALQALHKDSKDVFVKGYIENYVQRPVELESTCLACFATQFTIDKKTFSNDDEDEKDSEDEEKEEIEATKYVSLDGTYTLKRLKKQRILRYKSYKEADDPWNFYRSNVFLFLPWRDEQKEVLDVNCKGKYFSQIEALKNNRQLFNKLDYHELEDAESEVQKNGALEDSEGEEDWVADDRIINDCLGVNPEDVAPPPSKRPKKSIGVLKLAFPKMLSDNELSDIISRLNDKQREFAYHYAHNLRLQVFGASSSRMHTILLGQAGVGKSFLTKAITQITYSIVQSCTKTDLDLPPILLSSFTGKSSFAINGTTLHSLFGIAGNQVGPSRDSLSESRRNTFRSKFLNVKTLIIDEISMVSKEMFLQVHQRLEEIFGLADWGGLNIVLMGELYQLNPVASKQICAIEKGATKASECVERDVYRFFRSLSAKALWDKFQLFELTEIMRQKEDLVFAMALNRLGTGASTEADFKFFQSLQTKEPHPESIHLFAVNAEVDKHNNQVLNSIDSPKSFIAEAQDFGGSEDAIKEIKKRDKSQNDGLANTVLLKISAVYMIVINVDLEDGLYNGSQGRLKDFELGQTNKGKTVVTCVWLIFDDPLIGQKARQQCPKKVPGATPIFPVERTIKLNYAFLRRRQVPLIPCSAITVHKSQGGTFEHVAFHIPKRISLPMLYVACSRAKTSKGLYIIGEFPDKLPKPQQYVIDEMKSLRGSKSLKTHYSGLQSVKDFLTISFNIRSLRKYCKEVERDCLFRRAQVLFIQEPNSTSVQLRSFRRIQTSSEMKQIACFVSEVISEEVTLEKEIIHKTQSASFQALKIKFRDIVFVGVYSSPKFPTTKLASLLEEIHTPNDTKIIIQGDFNYDFSLHTSVAVTNFLESHHLKHFVTEATTNYGSCLDNVLSNFPVQSVVYESVTSDYRPIITVFQQTDIEFYNHPAEEPFSFELNEQQAEIAVRSAQRDLISSARLDNTCKTTKRKFADGPCSSSESINSHIEPIAFKQRKLHIEVPLVASPRSGLDLPSNDSYPNASHMPEPALASKLLRMTVCTIREEAYQNLTGVLQHEILNIWQESIARIQLTSTTDLPAHMDLTLLPTALRHCVQMIETTGDGSCFFNAASINLIGNENIAKILRILCLKEMCASKNILLNLGLVHERSWKAEALAFSLTQETCREFGYVFEDCFSDVCSGLMLSKVLRRPVYIIGGGQDLPSFNNYNTISELNTAILQNSPYDFVSWSGSEQYDNRPPVLLFLKHLHYTGCIRKQDEMIFITPAPYRIS